MKPSGRERRKETSPDEEFKGLAERSLRERVPVDELKLREADAERVDELRGGAKGKLLAMAGYTTENAAEKLQPAAHEVAPQALGKVLSADQQASLFSKLEALFTSQPERYQDIPWASIKNALEAADKRLLYGLFEMEENGHEVGVSRVKKGGKKGFRFDSCSEESPKGKRNLNYPQVAEIIKDWSSDGAVDLNLMDPALFDKLRVELKLNRSTWDHLKTDATTLAKGLALYGGGFGVGKGSADGRNRGGGFRCSLWVSEV